MRWATWESRLVFNLHTKNKIHRTEFYKQQYEYGWWRTLITVPPSLKAFLRYLFFYFYSFAFLCYCSFHSPDYFFFSDKVRPKERNKGLVGSPWLLGLSNSDNAISVTEAWQHCESRMSCVGLFVKIKGHRKVERKRSRDDCSICVLIECTICYRHWKNTIHNLCLWSTWLLTVLLSCLSRIYRKIVVRFNADGMQWKLSPTQREVLTFLSQVECCVTCYNVCVFNWYVYFKRETNVFYYKPLCKNKGFPYFNKKLQWCLVNWSCYKLSI